MTPNISAALTIFEGPDGSGKSTAAKAYAAATGAKYVHFPALPRVSRGLARMYVEAMRPALLGYQSVVFDRCWLSELPYGIAFREGYDRLTRADRRMLERLAMRCGAVVVKCLPPWEDVKRNYLSRKHIEMLDNDQQLKTVYELYVKQSTDLPEHHYDYTMKPQGLVVDDLASSRTILHPIGMASAGNLSPRSIVLVGESFAERKDNDPFYQWPFASFTNEGCSRWLTDQLDNANVRENELFWINADQDLSTLNSFLRRPAIALGAEAWQKLERFGIDSIGISHPQYHKRFASKEYYPLVNIINKIKTGTL